MNELEQRTKNFALAVIRLIGEFPRTMTAEVIGRQLMRSGTSVGANYREAGRGVSRADFRNKIGTVLKEAAESQYWLELVVESGTCTASSAMALQRESNELVAIFTAISLKLRAD